MGVRVPPYHGLACCLACLLSGCPDRNPPSDVGEETHTDAGDADAGDADAEGTDVPDADDVEAEHEVTPPDLPAGFFVVPPISDVKILPDSVLPEGDRSYELRISATPGEFEPASFVIRAEEAITALQAEATDLVGAGGHVIPARNVDLRVVKCWWQAGVDVWDIDPASKLLTPELLLKDDGLVRVEGGENYLRLGGESVWISERGALEGALVLTPDEFPVQDSATLQPVDVPAGTNKQFWITVHVPEDAAAEDYAGAIRLTAAGGRGGELLLQVRVLPIELIDSPWTHSLYYSGRLSSDWPDGSISSDYKSEQQLRAELTDMVNHGVTNPTTYQWPDDTLFPRWMALRGEVGMDSPVLYDLGFGTGSSADATELAALRDRVSALRDQVAPFGVTDVYIYGTDEGVADALTAQRPAWEATHAAGGKVFVAGYTAETHPPGNFAVVGDIQDLLVCAGEPSAAEAALWHGAGHQIFCYANPQVGPEQPERFRRNYGLLLWQRDYDGAMDFAYHWSFGNIWNDFDSADYRDHNFTYPTVDGVIDTIQWEGYREGVDDLRYLGTLLRLRDERHAAGADTTFTDQWLARLKESLLLDLDGVRREIVEHILCLRGEGPCCGDGLLQTGEGCDGENLAGQTCSGLGFTGGALACGETCAFDTCGCVPSPTAIAFVDPTPPDGARVDDATVQVEARVETSCRVSAFINWDGSLVGYWGFNADSGGIALDLSGAGRHATVTGAVPADGRLGAALRFDGVDDGVTCGDLGIPANGTATVEGWFYFTEFAGESGARRSLFKILYQHPANDELYLSGTNHFFDTTGRLAKNAWTHIALTWSGDASTAVLYVDASPIAVSVQSGTLDLYDLSDFAIGDGLDGPFAGSVDEVRVWNRVLGADEIAASYDAGLHRLRHAFSGLASGDLGYYASATDASGTTVRTETRTVAVTGP